MKRFFGTPVLWVWVVAACTSAGPQSRTGGQAGNTGTGTTGGGANTGLSGAAGTTGAAGAAGAATSGGGAANHGGGANGIGDAGGGPDPDVSDAGPQIVTALALGDDFNAASDAALRRFVTLYDPTKGQWTTGPRWSWANDVEASLANYERSDGLLAPYLFVETYEMNRAKNFLDDLGYDDEAWWANVWVRAFDATGDDKYLNMAKTVFADMTTAWEPNTCNGGIWWNRNRDYKNAITNELFILVAANLHNRTPGDTAFLGWATKAWDWFTASGGMINASNLVDDGLTNACKGNGQTTWTYNQGVILGAAAELFTATADAKYLDQAHRISDAAISRLVTANGILREPCETTANCNDDQSNFKGIFQRNLLRLQDAQPNPRYAAFLYRNAHSLWSTARAPDDSLGNQWAGPFDKSDAQRQNSGLQALNVQAPPWSSNLPFLRAAGGESFNHTMGRPVGTLGWRCDPSSCPAMGAMQEGPFISYLPAGSHTVHFQLAASRLSTNQGKLAELEVRDETAAATLTTLPVLWSDFRTARLPQDFAVPYRLETAGHALAFRVVWQALSSAPALTVTDVSVDQPHAFSSPNFDHACGRLDAFQNWEADRQRDTASCALASGPGVALTGGHAVAHFELKVDNFDLDDAPVVKLAVVDRATGTSAVESTLTRKKFPNALFQDFALEFTATSGHSYDLVTTWQQSALAPRVTLRGASVNVTVDESVTLPFDTRGIGTAAADGNLDGTGSSFAATSLGTSATIGGHRFVFGGSTPGTLNVLSANGQEIALRSKPARELDLLVLAVNGTQPNLDFVVHYGDGSSDTLTRSISDWVANTPESDESYAAAAPSRWSQTGLEYGNFHLFRVALPLNEARTVRSLSLPANPNLKVFAATLSSAG